LQGNQVGVRCLNYFR
jgi:hypothetical protein